MTNLGMGVMINMLGGNEETVAAVKAVLKKKIASLSLVEDKIRLTTTDGKGIELWDDGQSCCESRYITTDDNLADFIGAKLLDIEVKSAPDKPAEYGTHEVQFLRLKTNRGIAVFETHNEHNGYYGGFYIKARSVEAK